MTKKSDIKLPEGYLPALQEKLRAIPGGAAQEPTVFQRVSPWLAYAASLLVLAAVANFIFHKAEVLTEEEEDWEYVAYLAQSLDPDGLPVLTDFDF